jgi:hypothetical protein
MAFPKLFTDALKIEWFNFHSIESGNRGVNVSTLIAHISVEEGRQDDSKETNLGLKAAIIMVQIPVL